MDLMSFAFGILVMIGLLFITILVVGFVKVAKHGKKLTDLEVLSNEQFRIIQDNSDEINNELVNQITRVESVLMIEIERVERELRSYIDSRIDKLNK